MSNSGKKKVGNILAALTVIGLVVAILNDGTGFYDWIKQNIFKVKNESSVENDRNLRNIRIEDQGNYVEGNQTIIYEAEKQDSVNKKILFYFYETHGFHCWAFPVLKMYEDKTFVLDIVVYDDQAETDAARFKGTWEFVFYKYILTFSKTPHWESEDFKEGIKFRDGKLEFSKEIKEFSMWDCLVQKRNEIDMNRFKEYDILKNYDATE